MIIIISNNYILGGWELNGQEKQRTDIFGGIWRGATSSSGGTQPKYKVQVLFIHQQITVVRWGVY